MDKVIIRIEAEINPTESEEKVRKAIENIFGSVQIKIEPLHKGAAIVVETEAREHLVRLRNALRRERIRAAARLAFLEGINGRAFRFFLNKQAAFAGHVSFSTEITESPLGPIRVMVKGGDSRKLVDWLTIGAT